MSMTYNSLLAQIQSYLNRTDASTLSQIPNFIELATQRICLRAENIGFQQTVNGTFIPTESMMQKPGLWRRTISFSCGVGSGSAITYSPILCVAAEVGNLYAPQRAVTGVPKYYADGYPNYYDITLFPAPDQAYPFEYVYLEKPVTITNAQQTNWITNYAPQLYLYGTLLEAIPFLMNDDRIPVWTQMFNEGCDLIIAQNAKRFTDRQTDRTSL